MAALVKLYKPESQQEIATFYYDSPFFDCSSKSFARIKIFYGVFEKYSLSREQLIDLICVMVFNRRKPSGGTFKHIGTHYFNNNISMQIIVNRMKEVLEENPEAGEVHQIKTGNHGHATKSFGVSVISLTRHWKASLLTNLPDNWKLFKVVAPSAQDNNLGFKTGTRKVCLSLYCDSLYY